MQNALALLTLVLMSFTAQAAINVYPASINFYNVKIGSFGPSQRINVQNFGPENEQISVLNSCYGDFNIGNWCTLSLGPNQSCSIEVQFSPRREGYQNCSIQIMGTHGSGYVSVSAQGVR